MKKFFLVVLGLFLVFVVSYFYFPSFFSGSHEVAFLKEISSKASTAALFTKETIPVSHVQTPKAVKAVYMTSWVASSPKIRDTIVSLIDNTEINSVVIDIKDYTGKISFKTPDNPYLTAIGSEENRIRDIGAFLQLLHEKNVYVIGRIAVFQDPYFVLKHPNQAVKRKSDGKIWKDRKGISWLDAGSKEVWDYVIEISREAHKLGFDEINFDYIRFPSDGDMSDIAYPKSQGKVKATVMNDFFSYLHDHLALASGDSDGKSQEGERMVISADLFGLSTSSRDDLGIGQILENALLYFDYVSPMVYPSHYPPTFNGFKNPADHPYEVVKFAMDSAVTRAKNASTTPEKLRPWLQDFNLGAMYTKDMVRAQIQATYDAGLDSWMLWDPSNTYTEGALLDK